MKALLKVEREFMKARIPLFSVGDTVKVHVKVVEGDKVRNQIFQGAVIGRRGGGLRETFTVRKVSSNVAVERTFPLHSPSVVKIERIREGRVRRAQLTYMKARKGKTARISGIQAELTETGPAAAPGESAAPAAGEAAASKPAEVSTE